MNIRTFFLLLVLFCLGSFSFAQDSLYSQNLDLSHFSRDAVNSIQFKFCNSGLDQSLLLSKLSLSSRPEQYQDVCGVLYNNSVSPLTITLSFVSASLKDGALVCENGGSPFASGSLLGWQGGDVTLSGGAYGIYHSRVSFVDTGIHNLCVVYSVISSGNQSDGMFNFVIRRVAHLSVFVSGNVYYWQWFDDSLFFVQEHKRTLIEIILVVLAILLAYEIAKQIRKKK